MELKRYWHERHETEYDAVQLTPENMEEVAKHFHLEHVKDYVNVDGFVEEALFRPGYAVPVVVGMFVVQQANTDRQAYAVHAGDFSIFYEEIEPHAFIPQIGYSDPGYPVSCVFCGNSRYAVPYHRDPVPGETIKLSDGTNLRLQH